MKRKLILTVMSAAVILSGCAGKKAAVTEIVEPVEITLSWWGNDPRHEYTLEAVKRFERLHPEITVKCNYSEWSGYQTRSNVYMISGTEADVMQINYAWIEQYSPDGNGYYDLSTIGEELDLSTFGEHDLDFGMQNGKLNAVPIAMNTQTVYINKTVYDSYGLDVPVTWEDFFDAAKVMCEDEIYPIGTTAKSAFFFITAYAEQVSGKKFMELDGTLNFTKKEFRTMIDFYCRLISERVIPQVEYFDRTKIDSGKYAGAVAWLSDGSNYCDSAVKNGYEFVIADYPAGEGASSGDGWYAKPATMYAISKNTSHPEEAAILLDYLLNSKQMAGLQGVEKGIPLSSAARDYLSDNDKLEGMQYEAFKKMTEYDQLMILSPYFENDTLISKFRDACNKVLYEKGDADTQAEEVYRMFSEALGG